MSLDAIHSGFEGLTAYDEATSATTTLSELAAADATEYAVVKRDIATALGGNITDANIDTLLTNATDLTVDQAIAYIYQMVTIADTEPGTDGIQFDGTFEDALGTALGLDGESTTETLDNELGDIAAVFADADIEFEGEDTTGLDDDKIHIKFTDDDLSTIFTDLEETTQAKLGFSALSDDPSAPANIISWGYIPNEDNDTGEIGFVTDYEAASETVPAADETNPDGGDGNTGGEGDGQEELETEVETETEMEDGETCDKE